MIRLKTLTYSLVNTDNPTVTKVRTKVDSTHTETRTQVATSAIRKSVNTTTHPKANPMFLYSSAYNGNVNNMLIRCSQLAFSSPG